MQNYASSYCTYTHVAYSNLYQHICHIFNFGTDREKCNRNMYIKRVHTSFMLHHKEHSIKDTILSAHPFYFHHTSCSPYVLHTSWCKANKKPTNCSAPSAYRNILSPAVNWMRHVMNPTFQQQITAMADFILGVFSVLSLFSLSLSDALHSRKNENW